MAASAAVSFSFFRAASSAACFSISAISFFTIASLWLIISGVGFQNFFSSSFTASSTTTGAMANSRKLHSSSARMLPKPMKSIIPVKITHMLRGSPSAMPISATSSGCLLFT